MVTRIVQGWKELDTNTTVLGDIEIGEGQLRTFGEAVTAYTVGSATSVPSATLTTVATLTANGINMVVVIPCSGQDYAKWQLFVNSTLKQTMRSGPSRNVSFYFNHPYTIDAGDVMDVKVTHYFTGETLDFEATIYGFKYVAPAP